MMTTNKALGPLEILLWSQKSESWDFWFSHSTKTNIQGNIKYHSGIMMCDYHAPHSGSAASAANPSSWQQIKTASAQRIQSTAWEGMMANTRLWCFEKAATDASIMFRLSFLNTALFGEAAAASQPAVFSMASLLSLQELLVYQLSSDSFPNDFLSPFLLVLPLELPTSSSSKLVCLTNISWKIYWSRLFLVLMIQLINFAFYSPANLFPSHVTVLN